MENKINLKKKKKIFFLFLCQVNTQGCLAVSPCNSTFYCGIYYKFTLICPNLLNSNFINTSPQSLLCITQETVRQATGWVIFKCRVWCKHPHIWYILGGVLVLVCFGVEFSFHILLFSVSVL